MADLKLTPARIALLRAVADPHTQVYASIGASLRITWADADVWMRAPNEVSRKVTKRVAELEAAGLVKRGPAGVRYHQPRPYALTEAGEKALAELDAKETKP